MARTGITAAEKLVAALNRQLFKRIRTDDELRQLVLTTARRHQDPYSFLLHAVLGTPRDMDDHIARDVWNLAVQRKRSLSTRLGRPVHLRVAALDLVSQPRDNAAPPASWPSAAPVETDVVALALISHELRQPGRKPPAVLRVEFATHSAPRSTAPALGLDALRELTARAMRDAAGTADHVSVDSTGGWILLMEGDEARARQVAARVRGNTKRFAGVFPHEPSFGIAMAGKGDTPDDVLRRARNGLASPEPPPRPPVDVARKANKRPVIVYATAAEERLRVVHAHCAAWGVLLVPAADAATAAALHRLLKPVRTLADFMFPPRGGVALLRGMGLDDRTNLVLAPTDWVSVRHGGGLPRVVAWPRTAADAARTVLQGLGSRQEPLPPLAPGETADLLQSVRAACSSRGGPSKGQGAVIARLELDVVLAAVGG